MFKNPDSIEDGQDWESGSVTFYMNQTDDSVGNVTASCETLDTRPKATVTWMIGNLLYISDRLKIFNTEYFTIK